MVRLGVSQEKELSDSSDVELTKRASLTLKSSGMKGESMIALWTVIQNADTRLLQLSFSEPTAALLSILWSSPAQVFGAHDSSISDIGYTKRTRK
jgi:hypothetical protein